MDIRAFTSKPADTKAGCFTAISHHRELLGDAARSWTTNTSTVIRMLALPQPVIFRATEQGFIKMDQALTENKNAAAGSARRNSRSEMVPAWGEDRSTNDLKAPGLVRSRQRFWGCDHRFLFDACGTRPEILKALTQCREMVERKARTRGTSIPRKNYCPPERRAPAAHKWRKENDILDVWFDSGSSNLSVLRARSGGGCLSRRPDQYRGWFHSSLLGCDRHPRRWPIAAWSPTAGRSMSRAADVQIAGNRFIPSR